MNKLLLLCSIASLEVESRSNCYSCASSNMKANFLTSPRGPSGRKKEPLTYDNHCDDDPWIIKQRSTESCETKCFKWQQLLNNSGSFSKMTFRGCYDTMFDIRNPSTHAIPDHNFCTAGEVQLTCLADASIIEHSCWCEGDYCNASQGFSVRFISFPGPLLTPAVLMEVCSTECDVEIDTDVRQYLDQITSHTASQFSSFPTSLCSTASDIYPQDGRRSVENLSQSGLSDEDIEVERDQLKSTQSAGEVLCEKLKASKQIKRISIMRPQMWSQKNSPKTAVRLRAATPRRKAPIPHCERLSRRALTSPFNRPTNSEDSYAGSYDYSSGRRLVKIVAKTPELTHCSGSFDSSEVTCGDDDNTQLGVPSLSSAPTTESQSCVKNLTSKTRKTKEKKKNEEGKTEAKSKVEAVLNKGVKVSESLKAKEAKEVETAKASVSLKVKEPENVESTEEIKKGTKVEAFFDGGGAQVAISLLASLDGQKLQVVAK
ncbi:hypothetical protein Q1695_001981 [Nippostrongylus brasiliensis]|nr:hypothetical protein Q1695_001981 [Nippostrongylus brasiliensis]